MTGAKDASPEQERKHPMDELSEDLDVAIHEYLERNPGTSRERIRSAIRFVERRTGTGWKRRALAALLLLTALVGGVVLGLVLG